jgi:hypothetical protein
VRFRQVLVVGPLADAQVRHGVEPQRVDAEIEPELHHVDHRVDDRRVVVIQIRLVREEAVPEVLASDRVEGPVRLLGVGEDDPRLGKLLVGVAPDVELALGRAGRRLPRPLEPRMLIRRVVDDQLDQHLDVTGVGGIDKRLEVVERAVARMDVLVIGDVVAVVLERRGEERQDPQAGNPERLQIVELLGHALEVADAVVVAVEERFDVRLVDDGVLVPQRIGVGGGRRGVGGQAGRDRQALRVGSHKMCPCRMSGSKRT